MWVFSFGWVGYSAGVCLVLLGCLRDSETGWCHHTLPASERAQGTVLNSASSRAVLNPCVSPLQLHPRLTACLLLLLLLDVCRMAQVLESLHRADRAVVVLQDALKGPANAVDPATTRGHELTHGANVLQLSTADRRKFEDMLATAQVRCSLHLRWGSLFAWCLGARFPHLGPSKV